MGWSFRLITLEGTWFAWPSWPDFRFLIPDTPLGKRAAEMDLLIYPPRTFRGIINRVIPGLATATLPKQGIQLYRYKAHLSPSPDYRTRLVEGLSHCVDLAWLKNLPADRWLLYSGRLGQGNPILLFALDAQGHPKILLKSARFPHLPHLREETQQLNIIINRLGDVLSQKIIAPIATAKIDERTVLAYRFESCFPFFGLRWWLMGRTNLLRTMTVWLVAVAQQTAHSLPASTFWEKHGAPLERLLVRNVLPTPLAEAAKQALAILRSYQSQPFAILEHGDLGFYNIRLTHKWGRDFKVLDWGSSDLDGIPLGDLCYLLNSVNAPTNLAAQCLDTYLNRMGYPRRIALPLWLSYMARRWEELDSIRSPMPDDSYSGGGVLLHSTTQVERYIRVLGE